MILNKPLLRVTPKNNNMINCEKSRSCMSIESICWWSYPIGCNRWDSSGSWSISYFYRYTQAYRIVNGVNNKEDNKRVRCGISMSGHYQQRYCQEIDKLVCLGYYHFRITLRFPAFPVNHIRTKKKKIGSYGPLQAARVYTDEIKASRTGFYYGLLAYWVIVIGCSCTFSSSGSSSKSSSSAILCLNRHLSLIS